MEKVSKFIEPNELTPREQSAHDFLDEHAGATNIQACRAVYGRCDVFLLKNLSQIFTALRKKGYLFYTVRGQIWDIGSKDTKLEIKLIAQKSLGKKMIGYLKSNIRVMQQATDKAQLEPVKEQLVEAVQILVKEKVINLMGLRRLIMQQGRQKPVKLLK